MNCDENNTIEQNRKIFIVKVHNGKEEYFHIIHKDFINGDSFIDFWRLESYTNGCGTGMPVPTLY